ncbi:response regulator [Ferviditalea candida]|uniref:histidine kinase n=1 Tax=Ferviditalea candida TaxID=3108399 RepID=A0ABU5ZKB3_9BACL|nr:response regulator [Paenibacillaceae bacterium T2]
MKYKTRLYLGFGSVVLLMTVLLSVAMNILNGMDRDMNEIVSNRYEKVKLATVIRYESNNMGTGLINLLIENNPDRMEQNIDFIQKSRHNAEAALDTLAESVTQDRAKQLITDLKLLNNTHAQVERQIVELAKAGKRAEALQKFTDSQQIRSDLYQTIEELKSYQEKQMDTALLQSNESYHQAANIFVALVIAALLIGAGITIWVIQSIVGNLNKITSVIASTADGPTDKFPRVELVSGDEIGEIAAAFNNMAQKLEEHAEQEKQFNHTIQEQSWLKTKLAEITTMYQGVQDLHTLAQLFITRVTPLVAAGYGVFYIKQGEGDQRRLSKLASYADNGQQVGTDGFRYGEGLVGQCASENRMILLRHVPENYIQISSGLGTAAPNAILILPVEFENEVLAVVEFASFESFSPLHEALLQQIVGNLGVTIKSIAYHMRVEKLLQKSQTLTEELQSQSEELQLQQEELKSINEKLEEQNQNSELKTRELEKVKVELEENARQLALSSQYKSEFLANMSHELRTPLNSLLILAQMLFENTEGNLTPKQLEYVNTIFSSGNDLLNLINHVLDLSKVEAGKMDINLEEVALSDVAVFAERHFLPIAGEKGIQYEIRLDPDLPETFRTDVYRLQQILINLLSNAFKFTDRGQVLLHIHKAGNEILADRHIGHISENSEGIIAFSVADTGIGIPKAKQSLIFEAFQQADGTTSRKYGGTGLGLAICRATAELLGGFVDLYSIEGKGSTFTLYLPISISGAETESRISAAEAAAGLLEELPPPAVHPDPFKGKKILVVDDDMRNVFALTTALERHHMQVVFAENGREGIETLMNHPDIDLILMDIMMPELDGYEAMRAIRKIPEYRSLPIIALTAKAMKTDRDKCIDAGASDYISKPINLNQLFSLLQVWLYK